MVRTRKRWPQRNADGEIVIVDFSIEHGPGGARTSGVIGSGGAARVGHMIAPSKEALRNIDKWVTQSGTGRVGPMTVVHPPRPKKEEADVALAVDLPQPSVAVDTVEEVP